MKAIVFGGSGFLGQYIVQELLSRKYKVTIFDRSYPKNKYLKNLNFIKGDIQNKEKVVNAIKGKSIVYNFAGISDIGDAMINPIKTSKINLIGTLNILEGCKKYKIKRFIFASTIYVLSRQGGFYKASKQSSELFIEEYNKIYNLNYTILRYGSIYGKGADKRNGISRLIYSAIKKNTITYGGTKLAVRNFIHAKDAAISSVNILNKKYKNQNVLITGDRNIKIINLIKLIKKILKTNKKVNFKRKPLMGHYDKNPFTYKPKITKTLNIKPTVSLKQGIRDLAIDLKIKK
jgi:UDP-glucose 4-epimerase